MNVTYDITILPLLHVSLILLLLVIFSIHIYIKTNIKTDLYLAVCFGVIFILPLSLFVSGEERMPFWSRPYHVAALTALLTMSVVYWLAEKRTIQQCLPLMLLTAFIAFTSILPNTISGFLCGFAFICYVIWQYYSYISRKEGEILRIIFLLIIGICILIGHTTASKPFVFLYSMILLTSLIYETLRYFDRVVLLMKNAGITSIMDYTTGLFNKGYLMRKSEQLVKRHGKLNIMFSDIDNFKELNNTKGHEYGDIILIQVGSILKEILKGKGFACRFGGEEMVGLIPMGNLEEVKKIAEKFRERVEKEVGVTVSVGIASSTEISMKSDPDLHILTLRKADERMYLAKNNGKNQVVSSDEV